MMFSGERVSKYDFNAPRLFVDASLAPDSEIPLSRDQSNYLLNVLRLTDGESVIAFNGRDGEWRMRIRMPSRKSAVLVAGECERPQRSGPDLDYLFAPLKHARLDYMVQKAAEMGVARLRPVLTQRTQATRVNLERMRANAIEAAEQCGILAVPEILEPVRLEQAIRDWPADRLLIFCDEDAPEADPVAALKAMPVASKLALLIGPEGGFDVAERRLLASVPKRVVLSLGPRVLRADTAAVAALALVQACLGDWSG